MITITLTIQPTEQGLEVKAEQQNEHAKMIEILIGRVFQRYIKLAKDAVDILFSGDIGTIVKEAEAAGQHPAETPDEPTTESAPEGDGTPKGDAQ